MKMNPDETRRVLSSYELIGIHENENFRIGVFHTHDTSKEAYIFEFACKQGGDNPNGLKVYLNAQEFISLDKIIQEAESCVGEHSSRHSI